MYYIDQPFLGLSLHDTFKSLILFTNYLGTKKIPLLLERIIIEDLWSLII